MHRKVNSIFQIRLAVSTFQYNLFCCPTFAPVRISAQFVCKRVVENKSHVVSNVQHYKDGHNIDFFISQITAALDECEIPIILFTL